jgi:hypothetical protein
VPFRFLEITPLLRKNSEFLMCHRHLIFITKSLEDLKGPLAQPFGLAGISSMLRKTAENVIDDGHLSFITKSLEDLKGPLAQPFGLAEISLMPGKAAEFQKPCTPARGIHWETRERVVDDGYCLVPTARMQCIANHLRDLVDRINVVCGEPVVPGFQQVMYLLGRVRLSDATR